MLKKFKIHDITLLRVKIYWFLIYKQEMNEYMIGWFVEHEEFHTVFTMESLKYPNQNPNY